MKYNILIVGVGGQGTLLASRILGNLAAINGDDCKVSEIHGMSQRGGSVVTNVKIDKKVTSPIIGFKDADIILAFEKLEAQRYINYLKDDAKIIYNDQEILPMPCITGAKSYPNNIDDELKNYCNDVTKINALSLAEEIGNIKCVNVIMIGALAKKLGISFEDIDAALKSAVKPKLYEINLTALKTGYNI